MLVRYRCDRLDQRLSQKKTNKNSTYLLVTISLSFISVLSNQMWSWVFASVLSKKPNKPGCRWPTLQQIHKSTSWCFKKKNKMSKKKTITMATPTYRDRYPLLVCVMHHQDLHFTIPWVICSFDACLEILFLSAFNII